MTRRLYRYLSEETGRTLAWGTLTGVRPTKIPMEQLEQGASEEAAAFFMMEKYYVSPEKARLAAEVAARENALLSRLDCEKGFSLYAGIPFCPSVCSYCSFSSSPIGEWKERVDAYLDALIRELRWIGAHTEGRRPDNRLHRRRDADDAGAGAALNGCWGPFQNLSTYRVFWNLPWRRGGRTALRERS